MVGAVIDVMWLPAAALQANHCSAVIVRMLASVMGLLEIKIFLWSGLSRKTSSLRANFSY
jgi:hypothetical protein